MNEIHFNSVDLNLLRILSVMLEERSVTRTGARLGLTQSAVSHSLRRLREIFDDPLFIRDARGMHPTRRASEIANAVQSGLSQLQSAISRGFDPAITERRFTVVAGAYMCAVLMPDVVEQFRVLAPRAQLRVRGYSGDVADRLNTGQADVVIGDADIVSERFSYRQLFEETLVWVVRADHPLAHGKLTVERLAAATHVAIDNPQDQPGERPMPGELPFGRSGVWFDRGAFESELARRGLTQRIGITVPDAYSALAIVRRSDMAALLPGRLVSIVTQLGNLKLLTPPYPYPPVSIGAHFRSDLAADPAIAWFLDLLEKQARTL